MRANPCLACAVSLAGFIAVTGCGGTVTEGTTLAGTGGTGAAGQGGSAGVAGAGTAGTAGTAGAMGGAAGAGGTVTDAGSWCYSNDGCAPGQWCDLEPAAPGMCSSGGKAGLCKPRPALSDCPVFDECPGVCGCNGQVYCSSCEAHAAGISTTADSDWCKEGGTAQSCGGWGGDSCPSDMFCDYPANDPCGAADSPGVCKPRPACPDPGGNGACGCDGIYYASECEAQAWGTDVTGSAGCKDAGTAQYTADAWFGGMDHVFIRKADWARDVCLVVHLAAPHEPMPGLTTPTGWGLSSAIISNSAKDCAGGPAGGASVFSQSMTGTIEFGYGDGGYLPCTVTVHATVEFTAPPSWVYPNESMDAEGLVVSGGCM